MTKVISRLAIFAFLMAVFAMSFASLVVNPNRSFQRVNAGAAIACQHSQMAGTNCPVVL